jgi:hypothetical protein
MPAPSEGILGKGFHGTAAVKLCVSTVHAQLEKFVNQGTNKLQFRNIHKFLKNKKPKLRP